LAGAAFRFGHSTIDGFITMVKDSGPSQFIDLKDNFFNSDLIYKDGKKTFAFPTRSPWLLGCHGYRVTIVTRLP